VPSGADYDASVVAAAEARPLGLNPEVRFDAGQKLGERMLVPGADARLGEIRFEDWLSQSAVPAVPA
jgi:hypothetical protein